MESQEYVIVGSQFEKVLKICFMVIPKTNVEVLPDIKIICE